MEQAYYALSRGATTATSTGYNPDEADRRQGPGHFLPSSTTPVLSLPEYACLVVAAAVAASNYF